MQQTRRTRKRIGSRRYTPDSIVMVLLEMLLLVKLYHWKTISYSQHKATDQLYADLNLSIDKFVEVMLGEKGGRIHASPSLPLFDFKDKAPLERKINEYKAFLMKMDASRFSTDLLNIRDEILGQLNQFSYLLTFQ